MTKTAQAVTWVGAAALQFLKEPLEMVQFCVLATRALVRQCVQLRFRSRLALDLFYSVGVQSLPVVAFSLTFVSLIMILEFSFHMKLVLHQDSLVPAFSTLLMLRELGPVVTCLLLTSRVGAAIAAEIGAMQISEQVDALRLLPVDPIEYLVVPRWVACIAACVCLSVVAVAIAIVGGAAIASVRLGYGYAEFLNTMFAFARFKDGTACLIKAAVFGTLLPLVACFHGFRCQPGSQGVGNAATAAVVQGSILIIIADFVVTYVLYTL